MEPSSKLTRELPHLWERSVAFATQTTGYLYVPKRLVKGSISACGGGGGYYTPTYEGESDKELIDRWNRWKEYPASYDKEHSDSLEKQLRKRGIHPDDLDPAKKKEIQDNFKKEKLKKEIEELERRKKNYEVDIENTDTEIDQLNRQNEAREVEITKIKKEIGEKKKELSAAPLVVPVPDGAVEWLLHEVGHWIVSSPAERLLPDYGYGSSLEVKGHGKAQEWRAWAFEEIVFAPFGHSRAFCPPPHRGGTAFSKNGPIPQWALLDAERAITESRVDIHQWRALVREWILWNPSVKGTLT